MSLAILSGSAHPALARAIAKELGTPLVESGIERFPDGEVQVRIGESLRGRDAYLVQPTSPPVDAHLLELLLLADAAGRAGASRRTAVIPYFGYARQDRRARDGEAVGARVVADLLRGAVDRVVAVDLHTSGLEGFFAMPVEHLSAVPLLADALGRLTGAKSVVVAPDLGAAKLADRYAARLGLPVAVVHKTRRSGADVEARGVTGDVGGLDPVIVDDMISTGGTIEAAIRVLRAAGASPGGLVAASHGLFVGPAVDRLSPLALTRILVADGVPAASHVELPIERIALAPLLSAAIDRLHQERSLSDLREEP